MNETQAQAQERIEQLSTQLEEHNHRYHVLVDPVIPDVEYDRLLAELVSLERGLAGPGSTGLPRPPRRG